ncbi:MAG: DinB family protein [Saprospiraceae bacterium]|nr:DinB family protein [Saprospiraceae bacterium]
MEERIAQWSDRIDKVSAAINICCTDLDLESLNIKPNLESWSIAQILDHIMTTNQSYFPMLDKLALGEFDLPLHGRLPFLRRFFGRFILKGVSPKREKKISTFPIWEPSSSQLPGDMVARFSSHQAKLKSRIEDALPLLEKGARIYSPASRMIVYSLADAFEIIVTHEERHLEQVKEVLELRRL